MALSRRGAAGLSAALTVAVCLLLTSSALGADQRLVRVQDDCDPATFNAAIGPGTCEGAGRTLFADLLAQFGATGAVKRWQFSRPDFNIDAGGSITVTNVGGETHTFTRVDHFGNGCSPLDNGEDPAVDCATFDAGPSTVLRGQTITVAIDTPGPALFQCLIHPWMRATVDVRARGNRGGG